MPGRRLGQHFLADSHVAARIADAAQVRSDEVLLEIGGGRGALTRHLIGRGARLVVVELDSALAEALRQDYAGQAEVVHADVLDLHLADLDAAARWVAVGNLPYYVTSPILVWLAEQWRHVDRALLMMQLEVAERVTAKPGTKAYGRLSLMAQYRFEVETLFRVAPGSFRPPPKVQSAVVQLTRRETPAVEVADEVRLFELIEYGFRWRRKTMATVLGHGLHLPRPTAEAHLRAAGVDPKRRAETLSMEEFARLAEETPAST